MNHHSQICNSWESVPQPIIVPNLLKEGAIRAEEAVGAESVSLLDADVKDLNFDAVKFLFLALISPGTRPQCHCNSHRGLYQHSRSVFLELIRRLGNPVEKKTFDKNPSIECLFLPSLVLQEARFLGPDLNRAQLSQKDKDKGPGMRRTMRSSFLKKDKNKR